MQNSLPFGIRFTGDLIYKDAVQSVEFMNEFCKRDSARCFFGASDCDIYNDESDE